MKTYLITGGCGFIGSHFIRYVLENNNSSSILNLDALTYAGNPLNVKDIEKNYPDRYTFIKGDITDETFVKNIFRENKIDYIVHFAAESHVDRSFDDPMQFMKTNVLGTTVLLNAAKIFWQKEEWNSIRFLHISTDEVYGSLSYEEDVKFTENSPLKPRSPYAASKASADLIAQSYFESFGFPVIITRCSNNFGPYQYPEKLIPLMVLNMKNDKALPIYGNGLNVRDWIYVENHCKALISVLEKGQVGEIYNISGEQEYNNITLVNMLCEIVASLTNNKKDHFKKYITFIKDRPGHDLRYTMDCSKVQSATGWKPSQNFMKDLTSTVQWYLTHDEWVRSCELSFRKWMKSHYDI
ncbi:MAG: dTDP-glucose 4,6-dehydratase [Candidatus Cloacimonas sp. 4484_140]|nr:MAG: dTDP-glucose 4,6-dehydratase [Candidatus Cloacimonas sp. 4484_140]